MAAWVTGVDLVVDGGALVAGAHLDASAENPVVRNMQQNRPR